jgi:hypothetical protein
MVMPDCVPCIKGLFEKKGMPANTHLYGLKPKSTAETRTCWPMSYKTANFPSVKTRLSLSASARLKASQHLHGKGILEFIEIEQPWADDHAPEYLASMKELGGKKRVDVNFEK